MYRIAPCGNNLNHVVDDTSKPILPADIAFATRVASLLNTDADLASFADRMFRNVEREQGQLRKLCSNPDTATIARALTASLLGSLTYLCNYEHVTANNGGRYPILELDAQLSTRIKATFKQLTGTDYD